MDEFSSKSELVKERNNLLWLQNTEIFLDAVRIPDTYLDMVFFISFAVISDFLLQISSCSRI